MFYSATNSWAEESDMKNKCFVTVLRIFLMSFAVSWKLDCVAVLSLYRADNVNSKDYVNSKDLDLTA